MLKILKEIKFIDRKPLYAGRYVIRKYSGKLWVDFWWARTQNWAKLAKESSIDVWYLEVPLPDEQTVEQMVSDSKIPSHVSYAERQILLRGARLGAEVMREYIERA